MTGTPHVLYVQLVTPNRRIPPPSADFEAVLDLAVDLTPVVEQLPPDALLLDVAGALPFFGCSAEELAARLRVRALARHDVDLTVGVAENPLLSRMIANEGGPGAVRVLTDDQVQRFLAPLPVIALPGIGPAGARILSGYGIELIGQLATTPLGTLQRILGAAAGRRVHERAQGIDPTRVTTTSVLRALTADRELGRDELDPVRHRRALLGLAQDLGLQLRTQAQATTALTLTVRYADRSTTVRSRKLPEATAHTTTLVDSAYRLYDALGLQRARVRAFTLKADAIRHADAVTQQLTFDPTDERHRLVEAVADRARRRFGPASIGPASLYGAA
jgi:nucleotidyltransferase/DNA polymerase involved in DNA repair